MSTVEKGAETIAAEEDAQAARVSAVLAHCLGRVEDADLDAFRVGLNALFLTRFTLKELEELRAIVREEEAAG